MSHNMIASDTKHILNSKVLLLGPPASGKSSLAQLLSKFGLRHYNLDTEVAKIYSEKSQLGPLSDSVINDTVARFIDSLPKEKQIIVEIAHHDYIELFEQYNIKCFDCIVVLHASQQTLFRRNKLRMNRVPELYIARCIGSSCGIGPWLEYQSMTWLQFDMDLFTVEQAASNLIDFLRRNASNSLSCLEIAPNPCKPYVGGNLIDTVEWSNSLIQELKNLYTINTALDVGCGTGLSIDYFEKIGIKAWGVEGNVGILDGPSRRKNRIMVVDFTKQWVEWPDKMDLVWCIEVLEHIPQHFEKNVINTICSNVSKIAFIAASQPDHPGYNHVNCKEKEYWIKQFEENGLRYVKSTEKLLDRLSNKGPFGMNCIKENGMLFEAVS